MALNAKICGINNPGAMDAALAGGARFVGLVFYPPSPRAVSFADAGALAARVPSGVKTVGLFVDADDETLRSAVAGAGLDMVQLHGGEPPARVAMIRRMLDRPVMKAIAVRDETDLALAKTYEAVADWLLFDAKAPKSMAGALPGGNAISFDWALLADSQWARPWMLAGGLDADNVLDAARQTGAQWVDVSSGVEDRAGVKSVAKIAAFLAVIKQFDGP
ncbi:MAG: phosphoribosylanthranilate isomerase [Alphaproteobacteria bacterium]